MVPDGMLLCTLALLGGVTVATSMVIPRDDVNYVRECSSSRGMEVPLCRFVFKCPYSQEEKICICTKDRAHLRECTYSIHVPAIVEVLTKDLDDGLFRQRSYFAARASLYDLDESIDAKDLGMGYSVLPEKSIQEMREAAERGDDEEETSKEEWLEAEMEKEEEAEEDEWIPTDRKDHDIDANTLKELQIESLEVIKPNEVEIVADHFPYSPFKVGSGKKYIPHEDVNDGSEDDYDESEEPWQREVPEQKRPNEQAEMMDDADEFSNEQVEEDIGGINIAALEAAGINLTALAEQMKQYRPDVYPKVSEHEKDESIDAEEVPEVKIIRAFSAETFIDGVKVPLEEDSMEQTIVEAEDNDSDDVIIVPAVVVSEEKTGSWHAFVEEENDSEEYIIFEDPLPKAKIVPASPGAETLREYMMRQHAEKKAFAENVKIEISEEYPSEDADFSRGSRKGKRIGFGFYIAVAGICAIGLALTLKDCNLLKKQRRAYLSSRGIDVEAYQRVLLDTEVNVVKNESGRPPSYSEAGDYPLLAAGPSIVIVSAPATDMHLPAYGERVCLPHT